MRLLSIFCVTVRLIAILALIAVSILSDTALATSTLSRVEYDAMLRNVLGDELNERVHELGTMSDSDAFLDRSFLGVGWEKAAATLRAWMREAGLEVWTDEIGNVHGRTPASVSADAPVLMLGSHFDTVRDGGKYDGALGVLAAISAVKALMLSRDASQLLARPIQVVGFADEEGSRFFSSYIGSRALTGDLVSSGDLETLRDAGGKTLAEVLTDGGLDGRIEAVSKAQLVPSQLYGYVELHIEQGPVLESMERPIAAVSAIIGATSHMYKISGQQGHAGTSPMHLRKDALAGAADIVLFIEQLCSSHDKVREDMLVCTVGRLEAKPSVSNVISGDVMLTVDMRAYSSKVLQSVASAVQEEVAIICEKRGLAHSLVRVRAPRPSVVMDESLTQAIVKAGTRASTTADRVWGPHASSSSTRIPEHNTLPRLMSGAGHDASAMSTLTRVGMIWVRCKDGISHSPREFVEERDIAEAATTLFHLLEEQL